MAGKAKTRKTYGRKLKDQTVDIQKLYAMAGAKSTPQASTMSFAGGQSSSTPDTIDEFKRLKTSGDVMIGAIAYLPKITQIDGNGAIDLQPSDVLGSTSDDYTSYLLVTPVGSADDLKTISNASAGGQILHLEANTTGTITLKHNTGNIFIPSTNDHIIPAGGFATLIFDEVIHINKWVLVSSSNTASSSWVGTATSDLDMAGYDIDNITQLEFGQSATSGGTISNSAEGIIYDTHSSSDEHYLRVDGNSKFVVGNTVNTSHEPLDMSGEGISNVGHIYFNSSGTNDSYIDGLSTGLNFNVPSGDEYRFYFNSSLKWSISSSQISGDNIILGNTLTMNDNSSDPAGNGMIAKNGNYLRVQTDGIVKDLTCVSGYKDSATSQSTGNNTTLDGWFGDQNGCIGVQYDSSSSAGSGKYRIWMRADGGWYKAEAY